MKCFQCFIGWVGRMYQQNVFLSIMNEQEKEEKKLRKCDRRKKKKSPQNFFEGFCFRYHTQTKSQQK